jgi:hypothetical protein
MHAPDSVVPRPISYDWREPDRLAVTMAGSAVPAEDLPRDARRKLPGGDVDPRPVVRAAARIYADSPVQAHAGCLDGLVQPETTVATRRYLGARLVGQRRSPPTPGPGRSSRQSLVSPPPLELHL